MAYQKQTFINDETVLTAEMLNHIEQGIVDNETEIAKKQPKGDYVTTANLQTATDNALAQAKASGEFDGTSATHSWNGTTLTITSASGTSSADLKGDKGDKGDPGAAGSNGSNGTSVTVKSVSESTADGGSNVVTFSDGKTLTVKNGSKGSTGAKGADGKTPVKGTDYFTDEEIAEIVAEAKPQKGIDYFDGEDGKDGQDGKDGTVQIEPLFAESVEWLEENGDTSKVYILPNNLIYAYMYTEGESAAYTNWLPLADTTTLLSGDEPATLCNGYYNGNRINSSGLLKKVAGYSVTGFIPYTYGGADDYILIENPICTPNKTYEQAIAFYDASHAFLFKEGLATDTYESAVNGASNGTIGWTVEGDATNGYSLIWEVGKIRAVKNGTVDATQIAYFRVCVGDYANAIITVNEEISGGGGTEAGYKWSSTGHSFIPTDYEDRIIDLEKKASGNSSVQQYLNDRNTYIAPVPSGYCESHNEYADTGANTSLNVYDFATMQSMFSALATANPDYITETLLGKDASGTYDIYKYELDLKPAVKEGYSSVMNTDKPVFIITAGLHGNEHYAVHQVYHFMKDLCENWVESDQLEYLRSNVKFVIVPISNPWGYVNKTYNNSNDVNLNKNFEHGFSQVTDSAGSQLNTGANAYSEAETVLLKGVFDSYPNAVFHLECHGKGNDTSWNTVLWFSLMKSLKSELVEICSNTVINQISRKMYKMGFATNKAECGYITYYTLNGRPKDYTGTEYGMLSCTMEATGLMYVAGNTTYTKYEQQINAEALENFVLRVLDALNSRVEI